MEQKWEEKVTEKEKQFQRKLHPEKQKEFDYQGKKPCNLFIPNGYPINKHLLAQGSNLCLLWRGQKQNMNIQKLLDGNRQELREKDFI